MQVRRGTEAGEARPARRDERAYREYVNEEPRSLSRGPQRGNRVGVETGCSADRLQPDFRHRLLARLPPGR